MKTEKHALNAVWEIYPENVGKEIAPVNIVSFEKHAIALITHS